MWLEQSAFREVSTRRVERLAGQVMQGLHVHVQELGLSNWRNGGPFNEIGKMEINSFEKESQELKVGCAMFEMHVRHPIGCLHRWERECTGGVKTE